MVLLMQHIVFCLWCQNCIGGKFVLFTFFVPLHPRNVYHGVLSCFSSYFCPSFHFMMKTTHSKHKRNNGRAAALWKPHPFSTWTTNIFVVLETICTSITRAKALKYFKLTTIFCLQQPPRNQVQKRACICCFTGCFTCSSTIPQKCNDAAWMYENLLFP